MGHEVAVHHNIEAAPCKNFKDIPNPAADGISYYTPKQVPVAGSGVSENPPKLFTPLKIRDMTMQNRVMLSPLCQYSADDGHFTSWHLAHLGGIISRGPGLSFIEATSVTPEGRITPQDSGLWKDSQTTALKPIVEFAHSQGQKIGIQLAHAGRKASAVAPWISGGDASSKAVGGWPDEVVAPSPGAYSDRMCDPNALSLQDIEKFKVAWAAAVRRSLDAGFDVIEIHNAHGYLLNEFTSPATNKRTDIYGGSFENRIRLTLEVVELTRSIVPEGMPLFIRISATDWLEEEKDMESWKIEDSIELAKILADKGVDLIDVSTGGASPKQHIHAAGPVKFTAADKAYQAPFAYKIKSALGDKILVATVGGVREGQVAKEVIDEGLDVVAIGRGFQKNPGLLFQFADELGIDVRMPNQISWAFRGRGSK